MKKNFDEQLFISLWEKGLSDCDIACIMDFSDITIGNRRRKLGLKPNKKEHDFSEPDLETFKVKCEELQTDSAVARFFKMKTEKVKKLRKKYNIEIRNYNANPEIIPTHLQEELIFGTLLGDGYCKMDDTDKEASLIFNHSVKQKEYVLYKYSFLNNFPGRTYYFKRTPHTKTGVEYETYSASFYTNKTFTKFRKMFYDEDGNKHIPLEYLDDLYTPFAMAIHFMDDGTCIKATKGNSVNFNISTCGFPKDEVLKFMEFLKNKYDINTSITEANRIYIKADSKSKFLNLISPYKCESMDYKFVS